jgi:hypothetical protein
MRGDGKEAPEIGYKKPPKATRFQKGKSGNPSGRPKKAIEPIDLGLILHGIDNEEIIVRENGKRKSMRKIEIEFQQQFTKAINGDLTTARLLVQMAIDYFNPEETAGCYHEFMTAAQARKRFGPDWIRIVTELNALSESTR